MIVREEAAQPLRTNQKRSRNGKQKEVEVMQVARHTLGGVCFSAVDGEGVETHHDDALIVEGIVHNVKV